MWHVWGRREMSRRFHKGNLKEIEQLENLGADRRLLLIGILQKWY
jgi:hypothetical protein